MIGRLITAFAVGEFSEVKQRLRLIIIAYAIAGLSAMVAALFFLIAAYLALAFKWGPIEAALAIGAGFTLLAIIILVAFKIADASRKRAQRQRRAEEATMVASATALAAVPAMLGRLGRMNPLMIALVGLGGFAAYRQFGKRDHKE